MRSVWWKRVRDWLCEKALHPIKGIQWIHGGKVHYDCKICGRIVSKPED